MIKNMDFRCVVDLVAGHGRNRVRLQQYANQLFITDINQECIDLCKRRFEGNPKIRFLKTNGISLNGIKDESVTLVYTFDSMVHFDSDIVREYLSEFYRVLKPGGHCFCHHSNFTGNPGGNFTYSLHWRNFMSKELFFHYSVKAGLQVVEQKVIDWSFPAIDCLTVLQRPTNQTT